MRCFGGKLYAQSGRFVARAIVEVENTYHDSYYFYRQLIKKSYQKCNIFQRYSVALEGKLSGYSFTEGFES